MTADYVLACLNLDQGTELKYESHIDNSHIYHGMIPIEFACGVTNGY